MISYVAILAFALPIVLARLIQTLGLVVGNLIAASLDAEVLAASALATTISIGFFTFASGNLFGISPLVAKEYGQRNYSEVIKLLIDGFYYATVLGLLIMVIFFNVELLLKLFHEPPELIHLLVKYYRYFLFSVLPMLWTTVLQEVIIGCHRQSIIYKYSAIRVLTGIFFAYVLVLGKLGFPFLGFSGLGLSVFVASALSFIGLFMFLAISKYTFLCSYFRIKLLIPSKKFFDIMRFGLPIGIQMSGEIIAIMVATLLIGTFGVIALAAQQITSQYLMLCTMFPFGLAHAIASKISKLRGEGNHAEVNEITRKSIVIVFTVTCLVGLVYYLIPNVLINPYIYKYSAHQIEVRHLAISFFYLLIIYQIFDGIRIILSGVLRGHGNSLIQMLVGVGVFWLLGIPLILLLINFTHLGAIVVPLSLTIAVIVGAIILMFYCMKKVIK